MLCCPSSLLLLLLLLIFDHRLDLLSGHCIVAEPAILVAVYPDSQLHAHRTACHAAAMLLPTVMA